MDFVVPSSSTGISVKAENVRIIDLPEEFYQTLVDRTRKAKHRIALSSLYIGDGQLEKNLVDAIEENLSHNDDLNVTVLLDYLRGTRDAMKEKSSTTLLKRIANKAQIYLFHTPRLSGMIKRVLPERTNEIIGVQHMKLYIFDDSILLSGANLSDSYFTNRQDRYILFENTKELSDFFYDIIQATGSCSFLLSADGSISLHPECSVHPYLGKCADYCSMLRKRLDDVIDKQRTLHRSFVDRDTVVYPILQMGPIGLNDEFDLLKTILSSKRNDLSIFMASGYFNCIQEYERLIFKEGKYSLDVVTAAPSANGFYGATGFSGYVPALYSSVAGNFLDQIARSGRDTVSLYEFTKKGWTFHAKGIWIEAPSATATIIGSSNYGYRSVHRDLEAQVLLVTTNEELMTRLKDERSRLFEWASIVDSLSLRRADHHVPTLIRTFSRFMRNFF